VSIDDRIRAATQATAATVREIRPLTLPADPPGAASPARSRRRSSRTGPGRSARANRRGLRDWGSWLIPLSAAAAVIVLAAVLVAVRDLPGASHPTGTTPAGQGRAAPNLPQYAVDLTNTTANISPPYGSGDVTVSDLSVIDTHTGKQVAVVKHPANISFDAVSGAADDRTFVVTGTSYIIQRMPGVGGLQYIQVYYLLRIDPGSSQPVNLTRLSIPVQPGDAVIDGLALSPDGRTLAVLEWCTVPGVCDKGSPGTLQLYSVATGKVLRVWTWGTLPDPIPSYGDSEGPVGTSSGMTWLADGRTLAFTYYAHGQAPAVRTLDTTRPGGDLVADSHRVFTLPAGGPDTCSEAMLTPDGRTVVCGTQFGSGTAGIVGTLEIDAYSAATGKREGVLYRYTGQETRDGIGALGWVGPGNTVVVMVDAGNTSVLPVTTQVIVGVVAQGKLIPLLPGTRFIRQGLDTIAF
jgi:hypothetical protein